MLGTTCTPRRAICREVRMDEDWTDALNIDFERHVQYILSLEHKSNTSDLLYFTDHKRLSGVYWALCSLHLLKRQDALNKDRIVEYVLSCYHEDIGGFGGNSDQDAHLLYTLSGVQVLALYDELSRVDTARIVEFIAALQNEDGSFCGDKWGEVDTRFSYCALLCLKILGRSDAIDEQRAIEYVVSCVNFDGGFGCIAGAESHAGQVFCCVGALALTNSLDRIDQEALGWWLCERQLPCGGFNGRPDKLEDVCYSWWVLSSLSMMEKMEWIERSKLAKFIESCQDEDEGGFADRPGDMADVFHTFFGLAALSLLGHPALERIDAAYALPTNVVQRVLKV